MSTPLNQAMVTIREALSHADKAGIRSVHTQHTERGSLTLVAVVAGDLTTEERLLLDMLDFQVPDSVPDEVLDRLEGLGHRDGFEPTETIGDWLKP